MKTKAQKNEELEKGKELLKKSQVLVFTDITKITAEDVRKLRTELRALNAKLFVTKKRLMGIALKEKGIEFNTRESKASLATVFAPGEIEKVTAVVFKFFKALGVEKEKMLGGYDVERKQLLNANEVRFIGQLPSREVLLGQLLGQLASPIRSFLYVLSEQSKKVGA
jgi:large subunit ribosomal protein L10